MRKILASIATAVLLFPLASHAQDGRVTLDNVAKATGAASLKSYPTPPNPFTVNLSDNIMKLGLDVDRHLPLHGRLVPQAELGKAIGR